MTRARELADLLTGGQTITTDDNTAQLTVKSTDADANSGPLLVLTRDSGSPADGDNAGLIQFKFDNDAGDDFVSAAQISAKANDVSDGSEDGELEILTIVGGSSRSRVEMLPGETVFNEDQQNIDFRVESDTQTHMLFVDADSELVTIGTSIGSLFNAEGTVAALTVAGSDSSTTTIGNGGAAINISNTDGTGGNTAGIHFSREDNDGNPHFSGAAIVAQFPDDQTTGQYPKGRLHFNTSTTENAAPSTKMTLLEDGKLGIGTSSPDRSLHIEGSRSNAYSSSDFDNTYNLMKIENTNTADNMATGIQFLVGSNGSASISVTRTGDGEASLCFGTRGGGSRAERARIDSNGRLLLRKTSGVTSGSCVEMERDMTSGVAMEINDTDSSGTNNAVHFRRGGSVVGKITIGDSSTGYVTSSDYRLKENIADMTGAIDRVKALAPKRFNFIVDADTTVDGFLAHEAQAVVPEAITGTHNQVETWTQQEIDDEDAPDGTSAGDNKLDKDGNAIPVMQGIDQSKLVPLLTGALQEAIAKIETLETEMTALKARVTTLEAG